MGVMMPIITLTTDFGLSDAYVGLMKGVILSIAPNVRLVDLCHEVPPQDVVTAALVLESAVPYFPEGTVHLVVVDPGVGTTRQPVAVRAKHHVYVAPDNGLLTAALGLDPAVEAVRLDKPEFHRVPTSRTFHGRDIFAPIAAHIANGRPVAHLGTPIKTLETRPLPEPQAVGDYLLLHLLRVDHFGNLITNLTEQWLSAWRAKRPRSCDPATPQDPPGLDEFTIQVGATRGIPLAHTYADVPTGQPVAYFGSTGRLEVAVRNGSAESTFRVAGALEIRLTSRH